MKKNISIPVLIGITLLLLMLAPVSAFDYFLPYESEVEYSDTQALIYNSGQDGLVITNGYINIVPGSDIAITLTFDDLSTKTGRIQYDLTNYGAFDSLTLTLDGVTKTRTNSPHVPGIDPSIGIFYKVENKTDYFLFLVDTFNYQPLGDPQPTISIDKPSDNPIVQISLVSTSQPFSAEFRVASFKYVAENEGILENYENSAGATGLLDRGKEIFFSLIDLLWMLFGIFKFFFIDNLLLVIALIEMGIIAYRLSTAPNIFLAFSFIISDNERLIIGIMNFLKVLVSVVWDIVNFINPMRWILGK